MRLCLSILAIGWTLVSAGSAGAYVIHDGTLAVNHVFGQYLDGAEYNGYWLGHDNAYAGPSAIGFSAGNSIFDSALGDLYDGSWVQDYSGPWGLVDQVWNGVGAVWDLGTPSATVDVFPFVDHGEIAFEEGTEFRVFGSNDLSVWTAATFEETWTGGYNPVTVYDDYTSRWRFGGQAFRYVGLESGNWETLFDSADCEIDAVARPVPEPGTVWMLGLGLVLAWGACARRRLVG